MAGSPQFLPVPDFSVYQTIDPPPRPHPPPPPSASVIPPSDIISRQNTYDFFVNVESSSAYDKLVNFQDICQKIINEKRITEIRLLEGEKLYAYNNVVKMIQSYNKNEDVKLILVGKKSLEDIIKHRFTTFVFKKGNKGNAYIPLFTENFSVVPSPFRPHRRDSPKRGKKVDKKSGKLRKNKRSKKLRV
jgi:hypothetical protein